MLDREQPDLVEICDKYSLCYFAGLVRKLRRRRPALVGLTCERMDDNVRAFLSRSTLGAGLRAPLHPRRLRAAVRRPHRQLRVYGRRDSAQSHGIHVRSTSGTWASDTITFTPARRDRRAPRAAPRGAGRAVRRAAARLRGTAQRREARAPARRHDAPPGTRPRPGWCWRATARCGPHLVRRAAARMSGPDPFPGQHSRPRRRSPICSPTRTCSCTRIRASPSASRRSKRWPPVCPSSSPIAAGVTSYAGAHNAWPAAPDGDALARGRPRRARERRRARTAPPARVRDRRGARLARGGRRLLRSLRPHRLEEVT